MNSRWTLQPSLAMMIQSISETEGLCKNCWKGNYANRGSSELVFYVTALQFPAAGWVCNRKACFCPWGSQRLFSPLIEDHKASEVRHFTFILRWIKVEWRSEHVTKISLSHLNGSPLEHCAMYFSIIVIFMSSLSWKLFNFYNLFLLFECVLCRFYCFILIVLSYTMKMYHKNFNIYNKNNI